jgi:hypothetical protein
MSQGYLAPLYSDKDDQEAARVSGRPGCVRHGGWPVVARRIRRVGSNPYHNSAVLVLVQSLLGHYASQDTGEEAFMDDERQPGSQVPRQ